ncbi:atrial natriuretic peptide receptor 1-like [Diadema setosum]|uniref:atrial natriuretic peptide receptor 1-like n=1 Tax=Diadema setosum TaxID=31175 RepID=UPI003B3A6CB0
MDWIEDPPKQVKSEDTFYVHYSVTANLHFFNWAIRNDTSYALEHSPIFTQFKTGEEARAWCHNTRCPSASEATLDNCCLYHVNVHSCPKDELDGVCGPWVPPNGDIFTHTESEVDSLNHSEWETAVALVPPGLTSIIAHIRLGNFQAALHHTLTVLPRAVCGNDVCEGEDGEVCATCPADCGRCPLSKGVLAAIIAACVVVVISFCGIIGYFYWRQEKMFWDESWIISYDDIRPDTGQRGFGGSVISIRGDCDTSASSVSGFAHTAHHKQVFTQTGIYNGQTIAVKIVYKNSFTLDKRIRKEVKQVRDLIHPNLCKFVGGCVEVPNVAICTEYCPKGALSDVLLNEDVPLNWSFRFSFCMDVARGMHYLHNNKLYHGKLTSSNCVIDDRWVVKIADFGLSTFRNQEGSQTCTNNYKTRAMQVYLPPESRSNTYSLPSQATDIYSYGVVLVEIASRNEVIPEDDYPLDETWRPPLPDLDMADNTDDEKCPCPQDFINLIERCWSINPVQRPHFSQIRATLHNINPSKLSPVDLMMQLMEKYSRHLESIVAERTQDLLLEKQKTDRLLYSMLPQPVADDLRQGNAAKAEQYESCTIFFSDIVGFTSLSSTSSPYEVVALLNKLYVTFDSIIDNYDVYKVETIGDAYMVVSGVPRKNGHKHAGEIASMALDLVNVCETFVIPHRQDQKLKIRAGIHSGSVVAGVVGLKMPRYCLFGDTVNTASRMESTGEALKIQASEFCVNLLNGLGGYILSERGEMPVKGKGVMLTYWVEGKHKEAEPSEDDLKGDYIELSSSPRHQHNSAMQTPPLQTSAKTNLTANSVNSVYLDEEDPNNKSTPFRGPENGDAINLIKPSLKKPNSPSVGSRSSHVSLPGSVDETQDESETACLIRESVL